MPVRSVTVDLAGLDGLRVESYAVFLATDERPPAGFTGLLDWRLAGAVSRLIVDGMVSGAEGDSLLAATHGLAEGHRLPGSRLFVFGVGSSTLSPERFAVVAGRAVEQLRKAGVRSVAVGVPGLFDREDRDNRETRRRILESAFSALEGADVVLASAAESLASFPATLQTTRQAHVP